MNLLKAEAKKKQNFNKFISQISVEIQTHRPILPLKTNIIHTKLRYKCILHYDLYKRNITNIRTYHFFFACKNYSIAKDNSLMLDLGNIDTNLLTCGYVHLLLQTNINIFSTVHKFMEESVRIT